MNKSNKKFLILSVFGIFFVVCGHCYGINDYISFLRFSRFILFTWLYLLLFLDIFLKTLR